jgi:hypothetical protein
MGCSGGNKMVLEDEHRPFFIKIKKTGDSEIDFVID